MNTHKVNPCTPKKASTSARPLWPEPNWILIYFLYTLYCNNWCWREDRIWLRYEVKKGERMSERDKLKKKKSLATSWILDKIGILKQQHYAPLLLLTHDYPFFISSRNILSYLSLVSSLFLWVLIFTINDQIFTYVFFVL